MAELEVYRGAAAEVATSVCRVAEVLGHAEPGPSRQAGTIGYKYNEWVLRPGTRLFVHGQLADRPRART
ncbi:GIDE domain-containing protein [Crossiella sp. CA-258035]|uniref:GIDE domain-containing protein n=1 Tax=Crossiella sp. CA-258035 TaxID=2981138 RepID=UPI0024BCDD73|nr:GIDE domain-containing protein [Crossiella sp. CA-258035]WHT19471.1 GIDE domain-containing protein [Crossiella sp. CA-258035]